MRKLRLVLWFVATTAVAIYAALYFAGRMSPPAPTGTEQARTAEEVAREVVTGEFSLIDHNGKAVTDENYRGSWPLIFFGFTHCPDVCPTTLGTISLIMEELGEDAAKIQPLFISVDPARDTPELLAEYVAAFHPRIIGLTGSQEQVAAAAKSHRAYYAKVPAPENDGQSSTADYAMDHSAHLYLMDPQGVYAAVFSPVDTVESIARDIRTKINP